MIDKTALGAQEKRQLIGELLELTSQGAEQMQLLSWVSAAAKAMDRAATMLQNTKGSENMNAPSYSKPNLNDAERIKELEKALRDLFNWCSDTVPYFGENWRGSFADTVYKRACAALGEKLVDENDNRDKA